MGKKIELPSEMNWDEWQIRFLADTGNKLLVTGRQQGKSTIVAEDAAQYAVNHEKETILIISKTERQAYELYLKILLRIPKKYLADRPLKHELKLVNGTRILSLPTGPTGEGIRGYTINRLYIDEAPYVEDNVYYTLTPMLTVTGGKTILLGTPHGRAGYFFDIYANPLNFTIYHINAEENIKKRLISATWTEQQREDAIAHLEREKKRMSKNWYLQEYCGEFVDALKAYFLNDIIKKRCVGKRKAFNPVFKHYMGVDIARLGGDESVFSVVRMENNHLYQVENKIRDMLLTTENEDEIKQFALTYGSCLKEIGIDAGAGTLGVSVLDHLRRESFGHKVTAIDNAKRVYNREGKQTGILKEDLYDNLRAMMERGEITLLNDDEIILSLKSVQYEYIIKEGEATKLRIFGNYTHCVEAIMRAAFLAKQGKHLNPFVRWG